jgi:hypothetical protein
VWRERAGFFRSAWTLSPIVAFTTFRCHVLLSAFSDDPQPMMPVRNQVHSIPPGYSLPTLIHTTAKMKLPPSPPVDAVKSVSSTWPTVKLTNRMCNFITASPTPFQAVHNLTSRLASAQFQKLSEKSPLPLKAGGKYYYTRNQSSLVAFTLPHKPTPKTAISFAVGHLDSPCLKIRPVSKKSKAGYLQVGVELYGGGIWHSWFDRDLSIAGRVIVRGEKGEEGYISRLVKIDRPLLRIPTLAIHLERGVNEQ